MADQGFANQPASNNRFQFHDVPLVEEADESFAQLMALFAAWRADIDSVPFQYSDEQLLRAWRPPEGPRPPFAAERPQ